MARARNIKPGFFKNADLVELPFETRLLFAGLWTLADRAGRLEDRPKQIKMELFPADTLDIDEMLNGLQQWGFVKRYEVDGRRLIQIVNFSKHQNPHRDEKVSSLPAEDGSFDAPRVKAPQNNDKSTMQARCEDDADTMAIGLIPDSLNTDSLSPDSGCADSASIDAAHAGAPSAGLPTMAGAVCITLRAKGVQSVNPSHPDLLALLEAGADIGAFAAAAEKAVKAGKGNFAYVLAVVKGQAADSQRIAANARASPTPQSRVDRQLETAALLTGARRQQPKPFEAIDVESRILPA